MLRRNRVSVLRVLLRAAVVAVVLMGLTAPAGAAAQDEPAAARAFADAADRFRAAVAGLGADLAPGVAKDLDRCPLILEGLSQRDEVVAGNQLALAILREFGAAITPALSALRTDLANVPTRDPALLSGRAAYRQIGRAYASLGAPTDVCATLRAWRRAGRPRSAGRAAWERLQPVRRLGREQRRKLRAATQRMIELGVPKPDAERFSRAQPPAQPS
jgi:hypothetical protein